MIARLLILATCAAQSAEFNRELSADRPDTTESPYTVEPGRMQVESTLWGFARDEGSETWSIAEANVKLGVSPCHDIQLVLRPWISETDGNEGFGDIDLRLKWNLWGNDGGRSAGALMPFVTVPTQTSVSGEEWEGGIIFPVAIEITERLGLGFQTEIDRVWNSDDSAYDWDFAHSAVLGVSLTEQAGMFLEYVGVAGDHPYEATFNTGVTWATGENIQWDLAAGFGINDAAEDFSLIQGVTFRF